MTTDPFFADFPKAPWEAIPAAERDIDPNSALLWLPPLVAAGLPVPRTEMVMVDPDALWVAIGESNEKTDPPPWEEMRAAASRIGYPCFVRTDLSSAKHSGPASYRLDGPDDLESVVCRTFEDNAMKDLASGPHPLRAFLFREWLALEAPFTAFGWGGEGHPIAREWRYFAGGGECMCRHFYWPSDAIEDHDPSVTDWRERLAAIGLLSAEDDGALAAMAVRAAALAGEDVWSVDFARDTAGKWWLIDMATARASWHPKHT